MMDEDFQSLKAEKGMIFSVELQMQVFTLFMVQNLSSSPQSRFNFMMVLTVGHYRSDGLLLTTDVL